MRGLFFRESGRRFRLRRWIGRFCKKSKFIFFFLELKERGIFGIWVRFVRLVFSGYRKGVRRVVFFFRGGEVARG